MNAAINFDRLGKPRRRRNRQIERSLQEAIVEFYRLAVDRRDAVLFAVPNGELRSPAVAALLTGISAHHRDLLSDEEYLDPYGQGVVPGVTDFVLLTAPAVTTLIEVKRPKSILSVGGESVSARAGQHSRGQKLFRSRALSLKHDHRTVHSLEEFAAVLRDKGLVLRARIEDFL